MPRRSTKGGVANAHQTSARKASTMRTTAAKDGTDGSRPSLKTKVVSGKVPNSVGQKGTTSGLRSSTARKSTSGYSAPGHSGGSKLGPAPKLGTSTAVSGTPGAGYGTAKAKNTSRSNSDHGKAVSGLDRSFGTAPAKQVKHEPYGTWEGHVDGR